MDRRNARPEALSAWEVAQTLGVSIHDVHAFLDSLACERGRSAVWTVDERCRSEVLREFWGEWPW